MKFIIQTICCARCGVWFGLGALGQKPIQFFDFDEMR